MESEDKVLAVFNKHLDAIRNIPGVASIGVLKKDGAAYIHVDDHGLTPAGRTQIDTLLAAEGVPYHIEPSGGFMAH